MSQAVAKLVPDHLRLLSDPQMMRTLANQTVIKIGGLDEMAAWAKRSDDNQGKLYMLAARLAPKEVAVSGSVGIEAYLEEADRAEAAGLVIDADYKIAEDTVEEEAPQLFMWPNCFFIDTPMVAQHT